MSDKTSDKKTSDKLLNCPFCSGEAEEQATVAKGVFMHEVVCKDCGFESKVQTAETPGEARQKAIAAWNHRKPMERILERLKEKHVESEKCPKFEKAFRQVAFEEAMKIVMEEGGLND